MADFDPLAAEEQVDRERVGVSILKATRGNPETAAQAQAAAARLGLPPSTAERNLAIVRQRVQAEDARDALDNAPRARGWFGDPNNASVAVDQAKSIASMEARARAIPTLSAPSAPRPTIGNLLKGLMTSTATGFERAGLGLETALGDQLTPITSRIGWTDIYGVRHTLADGGQREEIRRIRQAQFRNDLARPEISNAPARWTYGGVESVLQNAPILAAAIATRNPSLGLAGGAVQSGATQYGDVRARGGSSDQAATSGVLVGGIEALTEKLPLGFLVDNFGKTGLKSFIAGLIAREVPSEQIATIAQDAVDTAIANPNKTWDQYWAERPEAAAQTLVATVMQAGAVGAPHLLLASREGQQLRREAERAAAAPAQAEAVGKLVEEIKASPMPERAPERFASLMDAVAQDEDISIPAEEVRNYLQSLEPEAAAAFVDSLDIGDQLETAIGEGAEITVPAGAYFAKVAPTDAHERFAQSIRIGDGMSAAEAATFEERYAEIIQQQAGALREAAERTAADAAPGRRVFDAVREQAQAAGYTSDAARQYAALWQARYETRGSRFGTDAFTEYERSNVAITADLADGADGGRTLEQTGTLADVEAEWAALGVEGSIQEGPRGLTVSKIVVAKERRGSGIGTRAMAALNRYAEATGQRVMLSPSSDFGGSVGRLRQFYKRQGFTKNKGRARDQTVSETMIREPGQRLEQRARGDITFSSQGVVIRAFQSRNLSTLLHETGHLWLEELRADAARPGAPEQVKADWEAARRYLKIEDLGDGLIPVEAHETFARSAEAYFLEGRSPSAALRDAISRFKSWLVQIYKTVRGLRVEMTDDIRGVFDRLIATDEEIAAVQAQQALNPIFESAEQAGMSEEAFAAYTKTLNEAQDSSHDRLLRRVMNRIRRARTAEWNEERRAVAAEEARQVDQMPDIQALGFLRSGNGKLNRAEMVKVYGEDIAGRLPKGEPVMSNAGALTPDAMAGLVGYDSGDAMVQGLIAMEAERRVRAEAGDRRSARQFRIDERADAVMLERHGDVLNDGTIEQEALDALHNDSRAKLISFELFALQGSPDNTAARLTREALKRWAKETIDARRLTDLRPTNYLRAERAAGIAAQKAFAAGKTEEALTAKRDQLLNFSLYRAARDAQVEADKSITMLRRYADARTIKSVDQDYLDQIHGLLEQVDLRRAGPKELQRRESFRAWVERQKADGANIDPPTRLMDDAYTTNVNAMSVAELRGLSDTVKNIVQLGRLKQKLLNAKDERDFQAAAQTIFDSVLKNNKVKPPPAPADGLLDPALRGVGRYFGAHRKAEFIVRELDGFEALGEAWRGLYEPINQAGDEKARRLGEAGKALEPLFNLYGRIERSRMNIERKFYPEIGQSLSKWQVITLALNWGNEGNRQALIEGLPEQMAAGVWPLLSNPEVMTARDWKFVQGVWDHLDSYYPEIAAIERETRGFSPERVEPAPFETAHGKMAGGYYPLKYDQERSRAARLNQQEDRFKALMGGGFSKPQTRAGATNERVGSGGQPVRLEIGVLFEHVDDVLHDLTHRRAVVDVYRLMNESKVEEAIKRTAGPEAHRQLNDWLRAVAGENLRPAPLDNIFNYLRGGVTIANMGWKFSTAWLQFSGYTQSVAALGEGYALKGIAKFYGRPHEVKKTYDWIVAKSPYMASRLTNYDRDVQDLRKKIGPKGPLTEVEQSFFSMIGLMDAGVSLPTWLAGYEKGMDQFGDEDQAIALADSIVRTSQGSGLQKDLAAIQRGSGLQKLFTAFYSYFNTTWNMNVDEFKKLGGLGWSYSPRFAMNLLWINVIPSLLVEFLMRGGPDDDEGWLEWSFKTVGAYAAGGLVLVRDVAQGLASDFGYSPAPATQLMASAVNFGKQAQQGEVDRALVKAASDVIGIGLHLPSRQAFITGEAIKRKLDGEDVPIRDFFLAPKRD